MALTAVQSAMNLESKNLHPFFSKPSSTHAPESVDPSTEPKNDDAHENTEPAETNPKAGPGRKKRTRKTDGPKDKNAGSHMKNQASLDRFTRPPPTQGAEGNTTHSSDTSAEASLEVDPNHDRRKRQKTVSPDPSLEPPPSAQPQSDSLDWHHQLQIQAQGSMDLQGTTTPPLHTDLTMVDIVEEPTHKLEEESGLPIAPSTPPSMVPPELDTSLLEPVLDDPKKAIPKKQIKISKSGKLLSSPPKPATEPEPSPKKRRGRKPTKAKILPTVTVISYGTDAASRAIIGRKIEDILNAQKSSETRTATQNKAPPKPAAPPKNTHPFFRGKAQKDAPPARVIAELPLPNPRKSACTPGKLRAEALRDRSPEPVQAFNSGLRTNKDGKQSGLNEAVWPTGETAHVRNMDTTYLPPSLDNPACIQLALRSRKLKNAVINVSDHEDLVARLAHDLIKDRISLQDQSTSQSGHTEGARLPTRLLTTGIEIQRRINEQLLTHVSTSGIRALHPAIKDLVDEIEHTLTPFDEGRCEVLPWTQKYAPKTASHVLQTGKDAIVLKDWLQSLTVLAVSGTLKATTMLDAKQPPKKKRKKALDSFIVDDDEEDEDEEMIMIPGPEGTSLIQPASYRLSQWSRNKNVVLISGPHGSGKSATVHAVAKELGFEVFEINAGMRRSGKDIQDKVGDMTANHLVNHKRGAASIQDPVQVDEDTEDDRMDMTLEKDISSGRQGTMMSFFQAKPGAVTAKPKSKVRVLEVKKTTAAPAAQSTLPLAQGSRNSQKQSLILIEEADILFDEDQQFWAQIIKIASLSKRPIVITCNDERQIPMHDLPLAAILRLQPAPTDVATDYLLALAGKEGHILERQAVRDLYESRDHDLRASIMELDLWCQMSVGDRKGGLEWMYQRWPAGNDMDEHGRTLRVASEGTYKSGMGWLSHDVFETRSNPAFDKQEELLQEIWAEWGISPSAWTASLRDEQHLPPTHSSEPSSRIEQLKRLDAYADSLSAADVFCRVDLPHYETDHDQPIDATQPPIPEKSRLSYNLAAPLLQVDPSADYLNLDTAISIQTHLLINRTYPELSTSSTPLTEDASAASILLARHAQRTSIPLTRPIFASALDCLAAPPDQLLAERTSFTLTPSSFDRTFSIITLDLAPYVRSIVAHEQVLENQRLRLGTLLTAGGNGKRARTTRASRVALEGGARQTKRRDRWFEAEVDFDAVMRTAGECWAGMGWKGEGGDEEGTASLADTGDVDVEMGTSSSQE